jgi:hypothetical protein
MLLLIIPAIATGLAVVASQFQPARRSFFKNFRRRWTNWQATVAGQLDLMGDSLTQWSHRARTSIRSDTTSPSSEKRSPSVIGDLLISFRAGIIVRDNPQDESETSS